MGQYHVAVNLDKAESIHPHKLGCGLKAIEQVCGPRFGTGSALLILLMASCKGGPRGGGDIYDDDPDGLIGRWAGDRIAMIGDYAHPDDVPGFPEAGELYSTATDITPKVAALIERITGGKYIGGGWATFAYPGMEVKCWWRTSEHGEKRTSDKNPFEGVITEINDDGYIIEWNYPDGKETHKYKINEMNWFNG